MRRHHMLGLMAILALACNPDPRSGAPPSSAVATPRCYAVHYDSLAGAADPSMFPAMITLLPGRDSGAVLSAPAASDSIGFWRMFAAPGTATWRRAGADSLELSFSNGFSSVTMGLAIRSRELQGTATIHYDVVSDAPKPRVSVRGRLGTCPEIVSRAT